MLVDCDVHVAYDSLRDLRPYLDPANRELLDHSGTYGLAMPTYPWNHPAGWIRKDTYETNGSGTAQLTPAFELEQLRDHLLDRYDVTYAVTIPDEPASFSILPNPRLAAGLCSAYNDWLLGALARGGRSPQGDARRAGAASRGGSGRDPAARRSQRVRRRVPPWRRADPVRKPCL